ncbi:MAG: methylated-DNA-[protein]-cysteine S-methyltransferase [Actinomycetota bacterium]|nr:methylated-DNA-[protein]-cysteine S-methyltransferase [Actinomycetota bacterium]
MPAPSTTGHTVVASPLGDLTLVARDGALVGLYVPGQRHRPPQEAFGPRVGTGFEDAAEQFGEYFAGQRTAFDLPLRPEGTPFQQRVWQALRTIPFGGTTTYGELAASIGSPGAGRAVGAANGRNPLGIVIPCHRVVGANAALTGYSGGLPRKTFLLELERATVAPGQPSRMTGFTVRPARMSEAARPMSASG